MINIRQFFLIISFSLIHSFYASANTQHNIKNIPISIGEKVGSGTYHMPQEKAIEFVTSKVLTSLDFLKLSSSQIKVFEGQINAILKAEWINPHKIVDITNDITIGAIKTVLIDMSKEYIGTYLDSKFNNTELVSVYTDYAVNQIANIIDASIVGIIAYEKSMSLSHNPHLSIKSGEIAFTTSLATAEIKTTFEAVNTAILKGIESSNSWNNVNKQKAKMDLDTLRNRLMFVYLNSEDKNKAYNILREQQNTLDSVDARIIMLKTENENDILSKMKTLLKMSGMNDEEVDLYLATVKLNSQENANHRLNNNDIAHLSIGATQLLEGNVNTIIGISIPWGNINGEKYSDFLQNEISTNLKNNELKIGANQPNIELNGRTSFITSAGNFSGGSARAETNTKITATTTLNDILPRQTTKIFDSNTTGSVAYTGSTTVSKVTDPTLKVDGKYSYVGWGEWEAPANFKFTDPSNGQQSNVTHGQYVMGIPTTQYPSGYDMPKSGGATFAGEIKGDYTSNIGNNPITEPNAISGTINITADFASKNIHGTMDMKHNTSPWATESFNTNLSNGEFNGNLTNNGVVNGGINGQCYGVQCNEMGGMYYVNNGVNGNSSGVFRADTVTSTVPHN